MALLYAANIAVVLVVAWSVWVRRETVHSRWDAPNTIAIALLGLGAVLDSPWSGIATASHALTGKYYLLNTFGHITYLAAVALSLVALYRRLIPDQAVEHFMRAWIAPLLGAAALIMVTAVVVSPATSVLSAQHLYLVRPDGWLKLYWIVDLGTLLVLLTISNFGLIRIRSDQRSRVVVLLAAATGVGFLATAAVIGGMFSDPQTFVPRFVWPLTYLASAATAIAHGVAWQHRAARRGH